MLRKPIIFEAIATPQRTRAPDNLQNNRRSTRPKTNMYIYDTIHIFPLIPKHNVQLTPYRGSKPPIEPLNTLYRGCHSMVWKPLPPAAYTSFITAPQQHPFEEANTAIVQQLVRATCFCTVELLIEERKATWKMEG